MRCVRMEWKEKQTRYIVEVVQALNKVKTRKAPGSLEVSLELIAGSME